MAHEDDPTCPVARGVPGDLRAQAVTYEPLLGIPRQTSV